MIIIEVAMLLVGIYAIVTARVPSRIAGTAAYRVEGSAARWFGGILVLPLPLALLGTVVLSFLFGEMGSVYGTIFEAVAVLGALILAVVITRTAGKQAVSVSPLASIEATIANKALGRRSSAMLAF